MAEQAYGGFWVRVLAYLVDTVIVSSAVIVLAFVAAFLGETGLKLIPVLCLLTPLVYWVLMQASARQATFGKALLGMKVTDSSGDRISFLRSLGRELAKIVSGIPFGLGYLMAAFTGRKQALHDMIASTTVTRESSGHVLVALLVGVFGWIAPVALAMFIGGALIAMMMGTMGGGDIFRQAMTDSPKRVSAPKAPAASRPATTAARPTPVPAEPSADLETILASQLGGFEKPGTTRAGPAVLEIDKDFLFGSDFTIKAYLPPYRELRGKSMGMQITSVLDTEGANVYDPANTFEKDELFTSIDLSPAPSPVNHLAGRRKVHLKKGSDAKKVDRAEGVVHLNVAQKPEAVALARADVGTSKAAHGVEIALKAAKDRQVELQFSGDRSRVLTTRGFGADDTPLRIESTTSSGDSVAYTFAAAPERIEVFVAESIARRSFPFTLARNSVAAAPGAAPVAAAPATPAKPVAAAESPKQAASLEPVTKPEPARKPAPAPRVAALSTPSATAIEPRTIDVPPALYQAPARPGPKYNDVMSAVMSGDSDGVNELLALGRWPDKPDSQGMTPLTAAAMQGDRANAELLLKAGADSGRALNVARQRGDEAMIQLLERYSATSKRP